MVIISFTGYPLKSAPAVGKRLKKLPPIPSYMTLKGPYLNSEVGEGIQSINLFEFEKAKAEEAVEYVAARRAKYMGIPGFTYSVRMWFEAQEALKMIGLA